VTYDYKCIDCNNVQEEMHGMNDSPTIKCKKCSSENTKKLVTGGTGVIFKGGGWTTSDQRFKEDMTRKNKEAGEKSDRHNQPVKKLDDLKSV